MSSAFSALEDLLARALTITHPHPDAELFISMDESDTAIGTVLSQSLNGITYPLQFFSKKLNNSHKKYSALRSRTTSCLRGHQTIPLCHRQPFFLHSHRPTDHKPLIAAISNHPRILPSASAVLTTFVNSPLTSATPKVRTMFWPIYFHVLMQFFLLWTSFSLPLYNQLMMTLCKWFEILPPLCHLSAPPSLEFWARFGMTNPLTSSTSEKSSTNYTTWLNQVSKPPLSWSQTNSSGKTLSVIANPGLMPVFPARKLRFTLIRPLPSALSSFDSVASNMYT